MNELTADQVQAIIEVMPSTRWPIVVSLTEHDDLTVSDLARTVGKSVSWVLKQAKDMEEKGLLITRDNPLRTARGRLYSLNVERSLVESLPSFGEAQEFLQERLEPPPTRTADHAGSVTDAQWPSQDGMPTTQYRAERHSPETEQPEEIFTAPGFYPAEFTVVKGKDGLETVVGAKQTGEGVRLPAEFGSYGMMQKLMMQGELVPPGILILSAGPGARGSGGAD